MNFSETIWKNFVSKFGVDFIALMSAVLFVFSVIVNLVYFLVFDIELFGVLTLVDIVNSSVKFIINFLVFCGFVGLIVWCVWAIRNTNRKKRQRQILEDEKRNNADDQNLTSSMTDVYTQKHNLGVEDKKQRTISRTILAFFAGGVFVYLYNWLILIVLNVTPPITNKFFATGVGILVPFSIAIVVLLSAIAISKLFSKHIEILEDMPAFVFFFLFILPIMTGLFSYSTAVAVEDWNYLSRYCNESDVVFNEGSMVQSDCIIRLTEHGIIFAQRKSDSLHLRYKIYDSDIVVEYREIKSPPKSIGKIVEDTYLVNAMKNLKNAPFFIYQKIRGFALGD